MTMHRTATGFVTLICEWGHGKGTMPNTSRPATLITDDGDGHYSQWSYTGKLTDALVTLARLERSVRNGNRVAVREGAGYVLEYTPDDFWIIDDLGNAEPNLTKYPDVIAH